MLPHVNHPARAVAVAPYRASGVCGVLATHLLFNVLKGKEALGIPDGGLSPKGPLEFLQFAGEGARGSMRHRGVSAPPVPALRAG